MALQLQHAFGQEALSVFLNVYLHALLHFLSLLTSIYVI
jgi:hypothetical protein